MADPVLPSAQVKLVNATLSQFQNAGQAIRTATEEAMTKFQAALSDIIVWQRVLEISAYAVKTIDTMQFMLQAIALRGSLERAENIYVDCGSKNGVVVMEVILMLEPHLPSGIRLHPARPEADSPDWVIEVKIVVPK